MDRFCILCVGWTGRKCREISRKMGKNTDIPENYQNFHLQIIGDEPADKQNFGEISPKFFDISNTACLLGFKSNGFFFPRHLILWLWMVFASCNRSNEGAEMVIFHVFICSCLLNSNNLFSSFGHVGHHWFWFRLH